jgi:hypothetical protein
VGFLVFFFVTLFNYLYPPMAGKSTASGTREKQAVTLYFSDRNERFLVAETRYVVREKTLTEQATQIVTALLEGSKTDLVNTFPAGVKLQKIIIDDQGTATVSFSSGLIERHPGGSASEVATAYSLTNTLAANIPAVKRVRLLVDNGAVKSIKGHIDAGQPFTPKKDLVANVSRGG